MAEVSKRKGITPDELDRLRLSLKELYAGLKRNLLPDALTVVAPPYRVRVLQSGTDS